MKKIKILVFALFPFYSAFGQSKSFDKLLQGLIKQTVPIIKVEELKKRQSDVVLLDTREYKEFEVSHLKNARFVGYNSFSLDSVKDIPKNEEIVVYCSVGVRSEKIGEKLKAAGFTNVKNLYGSLFEWVNEGNEVYDMRANTTKKVHVFDKNWGQWLIKGEKVF